MTTESPEGIEAAEPPEAAKAPPAGKTKAEVADLWLKIAVSIYVLIGAVAGALRWMAQFRSVREAIDAPSFGWLLYAACLLVIGVFLVKAWGMKLTVAPANHRVAVWWTIPSLVVAVVGAVWLAIPRRGADDIAQAIFPQAEEFGGALVRSWGSNGKAVFALDEEGGPHAPAGSVRITFHTFGSTEEHSCGWVLFLLRGVDVSQRKAIQLWVRGEKGGEQVGIKAKDIKGNEVGPALSELPKITKQWRLVKIPLSLFPTVDFSELDNFSLYTNGKLASTRPQTIFVGGISLE